MLIKKQKIKVNKIKNCHSGLAPESRIKKLDSRIRGNGRSGIIQSKFYNWIITWIQERVEKNRKKKLIQNMKENAFYHRIIRLNMAVFSIGVLLFPSFVYADSIFQTTTYAEFLSNLWSLSAYIFISLSGIVIIIGLLLFIFGASNKNNEVLGKGLIEGGILSVVLIFFTKAFYSSLNKTIFSVTEEKTFSQMGIALEKVSAFIISSISVIAVVSILYSGFLYLTSGGKVEKIHKAVKSFEYSIIGILGILLLQSIFSGVIKFIS